MGERWRLGETIGKFLLVGEREEVWWFGKTAFLVMIIYLLIYLRRRSKVGLGPLGGEDGVFEKNCRSFFICLCLIKAPLSPLSSVLIFTSQSARPCTEED